MIRRNRPSFRHLRQPAGRAPVVHRPVGQYGLSFGYDMHRGVLLRCPPDCNQVVGYTHHELLRMGSDVLSNLLHPDSLAHLKAADFSALVKQGRPWHWVGRIRHSDGNWRWTRFHLQPGTPNARGNVRELVGHVEDITRRYEAVMDLRQETRKLQRILSVVPTLIYVFELANSRSQYCGPQALDLIGYTSQEIIAMGSKAVGVVMPSPHDKAFLLQMQKVATLRDGDSCTLDYAVRHRDGSIRWLHATHTPYERDSTGRVTAVLGAAEDMTHRRAVEEARRQDARHLAAQHHLFRQVIDALPHPVYLKNSLGQYVLANKALAALYGMTPNELMQHGTPQPSTPDLARYNAQDLQVLQTGEALLLEETFTRPDGTVLWFAMIKCLFTQADGMRLVLGVDSNITELKHTQIALEAAKEAAEENAQVKQDFLANMSHEIRTPLHGIIGLTDVLVKTNLSPSQRDYLGLLGNSAEHLLHVLNDVLTTARLGAGKLQPEAVPFEPRALLLSCAALLRPRAREKDLRLRLSASPQLPMVLGDAHRLRQVLLNLVSNALKFTESGEVVIRCRIVPSAATGPNAPLLLEFSVTDTGIGIAPEALTQIFEPFTQAASSTDREYGGSGLGLSISRGLVELLGGSLTVSSTLGQGSTFSFVIPCSQIATPAVPLAAEPTPSPVMAGRVLVVEDNPVNSLLVETVLRNWGWQVTVAANGFIAVQLFAYRQFDVVLMDIQMPGMDGETAAQHLRQHPDPQRAATPIIALTARAQPGEADRLRSVGFADYLSKPFRENQLLDVLRNVLPPATFTEPNVPYTTPIFSATMTATTPLYDLAHVRQLVRNDEIMLRRLAWAFIQSAPAILTAIDEALTRSDWQALSDAAHHLKSSLEGLGVEQLYAPMRELESYATTAPSPDQAARKTAFVRDVTEQVMTALRMEFPEQQ